MLFILHPGAGIGAAISISKNAEATLLVILVKALVLPFISPSLLPESMHLVVVIHSKVHLTIRLPFILSYPLKLIIIPLPCIFAIIKSPNKLPKSRFLVLVILTLINSVLFSLRCLSPAFLCVKDPLALVLSTISFSQCPVSMTTISIPLSFVSTSIRKFESAITMGFTEVKVTCVLATIAKYYLSVTMPKASQPLPNISRTWFVNVFLNY